MLGRRVSATEEADAVATLLQRLRARSTASAAAPAPRVSRPASGSAARTPVPPSAGGRLLAHR